MTAAPAVGLLVVHGIGNQKPFVTVDKVVAGLCNTVPDLVVGQPDEEHGTITLHREGQDDFVRLYEVYWADLMSGESTRGRFSAEKVQAAAWLPLLNSRAHCIRQNPPMRRALWRTILLVPLSGLAYLGLTGARFLAMAVHRASPTQTSDGNTSSDTSGGEARGIRARLSRVWSTALAAADEGANAYTPLDRLLDEFVGDVFGYVDGSQTSREPNSPGDQVRARFQEQLRRAQADGCARIGVLAHSLGTVIAFHGLTNYGGPVAPDMTPAAAPAVSRLWTIGSPLEKFAFTWPTLVVAERSVALDGLVWQNFRNPVDPVADWLRSFDDWAVENQRVWAGGVGRSHTVYETNARVLGSLSSALFGAGTRAPLAWWRRFLGVVMAVLESLALVMAVAVVVLIGAMVFVLGVALLPLIARFALAGLGADDLAYTVQFWGLVVFGVLFSWAAFVHIPRTLALAESAGWTAKPTADHRE